MHIINGTVLATKLRHELRIDIAEVGILPYLKVMLVGSDPASHLYVSLKKKAAEEVGIRVDVHELSADTPDDTLVQMIEEWNADTGVHGILVQLPFPRGHIEQRVIDAIAPEKDVDGFHPQNVTALTEGVATVIPPLHEGILRLIAESSLSVNGSQAVIIANSDIFASPLAHLLKTAGAHTHIMKPDDIELSTLKLADIVIIAIGRTRFLQATAVKSSAVVIDVGTNKQADGRVVGDVDFASFEVTDAWVTPVPGGVGPMTIAQLLRNVFRLACVSRDNDQTSP